MHYRPFGQTGIDVSPIGFGCWEMGGTYGHFDEKLIIDAVHKGLELGINLYDTAEVYGFGQSERLLGKALGNKRHDVVVVSKFGVGYRATGEDRMRDGRPERIVKSIETTLKERGTDYLDVYLVGGPRSVFLNLVLLLFLGSCLWRV